MAIPSFLSRSDQFLQSGKGIDEGGELRHLRTDMAAHPFDVEMLQGRGPPVGRKRILDVDAEFVLLETRRDMGVGLRIDIGIHPKADARPDTQGSEPAC